MKKLFTFLMMCLMSTATFSQISEVSKPLKQTKVGSFGAILISCDRFENISIFQFDDSKYQQIKVPVFFNLTNSEYEEVYQAISDKFSKEEFTPDENLIMTTKDNAKIIFKFTKSLGTKSVKFGVEKNGVYAMGYYLTQKQVKKLFDKV
ncbi:hypothetical protein [Flavobacterium nitrogenifigens]|uniref:DUF4252 domain-containing protein n=1 Tax=Flavobacterium nitrogenifigens TaxID=1617283 RepID=A0A521AFZ1_9FLAO|nr:hypothetical protein [Flavobacterium nitrogenifigens]KAF2331505.1 hypothetical protein DM397_12270 [Flavobacterium nitrogenifigens]SMO33722.1 hypothetical protein SAMN06265220_101105 [Flavobacterium nitrogenifigens]